MTGKTSATRRSSPATESSPTTTSRSTRTASSATVTSSHVDELAHDWFTSTEFDDLLVATVQATFPEHEHEHFVAHYRGLLAMWAADHA